MEEHYILQFIQSITVKFPDNFWRLSRDSTSTFRISQLTRTEAFEVLQVFADAEFDRTQTVKFILDFEGGQFHLTHTPSLD